MPHHCVLVCFSLVIIDSLNLRFDKGFEVTLLRSCMRGNIKMRWNVFLIKQNGHLKASVMPVRDKWDKTVSTEAY